MREWKRGGFGKPWKPLERACLRPFAGDSQPRSGIQKNALPYVHPYRALWPRGRRGCAAAAARRDEGVLCRPLPPRRPGGLRMAQVGDYAMSSSSQSSGSAVSSALWTYWTSVAAVRAASSSASNRGKGDRPRQPHARMPRLCASARRTKLVLRIHHGPRVRKSTRPPCDLRIK